MDLQEPEKAACVINWEYSPWTWPWASFHPRPSLGLLSHALDLVVISEWSTMMASLCKGGGGTGGEGNEAFLHDLGAPS